MTESESNEGVYMATNGPIETECCEWCNQYAEDCECNNNEPEFSMENFQ